jgi:hypothetical protein
MLLLLQEKVRQQKVFPLLFFVVVGSGIRDLESGMGKNQDPG